MLHTQCGGAAQNMADEAHYSVVDDAFTRSGLVPPPGEAVTPLGIQPIDKYIYEMLMLAGISVELLKQPGQLMDDDEPIYQAVQITDELTLNNALKTSTESSISYLDDEDAHGLQVKLSSSCTWKVTIKEEQHCSRQSRVGATRKRAAVDSTSTQVYSNHSYEILYNETSVVPEPTLKTTIVNSTLISIVLR